MHFYAHHATSLFHGSYHHGAGSWLGHTIVSALIHGLIYGMIFHLFRSMTLPEVIVIGGVLLVVTIFGYWWWSSQRRSY